MTSTTPKEVGFIENDEKLEEWHTHNFASLKRLNQDILEHHLSNEDEGLRYNHEQIQLLLDIWNEMPDDPGQGESDERKEFALYELLQLTGETFLSRHKYQLEETRRASDAEASLELAIALLQHAMNLGRAIFLSNETISNESMFGTMAGLGMAYDNKGMITESIEHLQMAQLKGEELFHRYRGGDEIPKDKTEFLNRIIVVCTTLGESYKRMGNIDSAIHIFHETAKYFDYDEMEVEHFEEMLRLMFEVGTLALLKGRDEPIHSSVIEHVKLAVKLQESYLDEQHNSPEILPSLTLLHDLYLRNNDTMNASELSVRIRDIRAAEETNGQTHPTPTE